MGRLFFIALIGATATTSLVRPWIGVVGAYVVVILVPHAIWWWNFDGLRPAFWILVPTIVGFVIQISLQNLDLSPIKNKRTLFFFVLWFFYALSSFWGSFVDYDGPLRGFEAEWVLSNLNKFMILYFIACICIDSPKKLKVLSYVIVASSIYLIYWSNNMYLTGSWFGRLKGPVDVDGFSIYMDENNFAMFFVVGLAFLWYFGQSLSNRYYRWAVWLVIPFGWHAIFLTGSRGGLVGLAASIGLIAIRSKKRSMALLLIPALVGAYMWQAGPVMEERAKTISEYQTEGSARGRIQAWTAAIRMAKDNPITGVGLASFVPAFPNYSDKEPREAHNTFLQVSAESGVIAGLMYLLIVLSCLGALWKNAAILSAGNGATPKQDLTWINEATLTGFFGLTICSLFLSLQVFEIFYYLCVLTNAVVFLGKKIETGVTPISPVDRNHVGKPRQA